MFSSADDAALRGLVDSRTFMRAEAYARAGALRHCEWSSDGVRAVGEVSGTAPMPYRVSVELIRSASHRLTGIHGTCSCPMAWNCKHVVALLLASVQESASERPIARGAGLIPNGASMAPATRSILNHLDSALSAFLDSRSESSQPATLGLHFEVLDTAVRSAGRGTETGPGIRIRPVSLTNGRAWTSSGISWTSLSSLGHERYFAGRNAPALRLLGEILALSRLSRDTLPYNYNVDVRLEEIQSRRLWDVLCEAHELEVPMVHGAQLVRPVTLRMDRATIELDARRVRGQLTLDPQVMFADEALVSDVVILLGSPAYALAWRDDTNTDPSTGEDVSSLTLAAFDASLNERVRALYEGGKIVVSRSDEQRFTTDLYPALRAHLEVTSSDQSFTLPELVPPRLVLSVDGSGNGLVSLAWSWGRTGSSWREDLWHSKSASTASAGPMIDAVTSIVAPYSLFEETPVGIRLAPRSELSGLEAAYFIADVVPLLSELGVEVELSDTVPRYREASEPLIVRMVGTESHDSDWLDLAVSVRLADEDVAFRDLFAALSEGQSHLILPSGTFFSLDSDELRQVAQLIAQARALHESPVGDLRLSRFQASLFEELCELGVLATQAKEWEESVRALTLSTSLVEHPVPQGLKATLRPYQVEGFNWLARLFEYRLGGVLADDMGLGKTLQALALVCHVKEHGRSEGPFLVIAPTSVVQNWVAECHRFAPDLVVASVGETQKRRGVALADMASATDVLVTSYALFRLEYEDYEALEWAGLFIDEAQFVKNRHSKTFSQIKSLPVRVKIAITGTPLENNLMELWALMSISAPGLFASAERFETYFRTPIERRGDIERLVQLRRQLRPLMLRRTKDQVASELPDKQEQVLVLELNPRHRKLYQTYLARERQKVLGLLENATKNRFQILRSLTLLRQASLDISLVDEKSHVPSTKLDALMEMLEDIVADGHRVVVFSQFTRFLSKVRERISEAKIDYCYLDGRTRRRDVAIAKFRDGDAPVFLISLKAGGFGLNLTEADYCIILDPWWNPATEAQAVDRIHRIGQTRKVMIYRLVAQDTIEEKVMALKAKKSALFDNVVGDDGFASSALSASDIRDLVE